jgi:orotate phosphoribosyltransferase
VPRREFRRGFTILPGERILLVDDILTTGGSLLAMIPAVEALGGEIVECAVLVDRSGGRATLTSPTTGRTYPLRSLWQLDLPTYEPGEGTCPRCASGDPLHAPGSTGAVAGASSVSV